MGRDTSVEGAETSPAEKAKKAADLSKEKVEYKPASIGGKYAIGSVIPSGVADAVQQALTLWEPRIIVKSVNVERDPKIDTAVICNIEYEINATHDNRNIVHPFYIEKEPEII